ncbi:inositol hexakisphosphate and diphosphoinositol-pentakisphosphate kinase 2 isoform X2 [Nematostella vectensis]|nr:inositol hexakisphosphate and diphosphoinositol-pentakisphosphate kinase 2 isoform X2 [Nematostella vectensis]XP_048580853.1 inositol hexakisphosphate and diphosphoinositol-pentakisphosphate kinase 2 isoform X2 [Nematostella vectensis]
MSATYLDVSGRDGEGEPQEFTPSSGLGIDTVMEEDLGDVLVEEIPNIKIGICAMNKKTKSTPMQEILSRIMRFEFVDVVVFSDDMILNHQVEEWPLCDALISFYSSGFPLDKAIEYSKLRNPFVLNDLEMQYTLLDRCAVYELLKEGNIETPRYAILMRDEDGNPIDTNFVELEDSIQIGNVVFQKPFVEKPVDAEDHNVFIYYPSSAGGGSQRLFRKVGSRSSVYSAESCVRKFGSYIYEDFVPTDGTDVKVYTVGPEYAHAEARKSPSLDGKVERDSQGKEIRYPVILNPYEKEMAHKVCELFKQTVCGFDLLRTHGTSYVCDVNGFSFVKTSKKYYDDCSQVLVSRILQELAPQLYKPYNLLEESSEDRPITDTLNGTMMELRCVIGIIRHGDRTPKQKLKMEIRHPRFIQLFKRHNSHNEKKLKLKRPKQLQEILDIVRDLLEEHHAGVTMFENPNKLRQLKNVLEMYGHFSGINRKIQLKYLGFVKDTPDSSGNEERQAKQGYESESEMFLNYNKEKAYKSSKDEEAILLIMKWGGELTATGKIQAEELGRAFRSVYTSEQWSPTAKYLHNVFFPSRCMYPGGQGEYSNLPGCGLLRLHSTYRHDLKIYASDEGRVQMTAAAFAKGFLALEGELTPILVHLVRSDKNTTEMLDTSDQATKLMTRVKQRLHEILSQDKKFTDEDISKLAPTKSASLIEAIKKVQNPREMCAKLANMVHDLTEQLKDMINQKKYDPRDPFLYHDDTLELMTHRWIKLDKDFRLKHGMYDISLIPDIYDGIKYDLQHNNQLGLKNTTEMYNVAKALADIVIPQEYGLSAEEKVKIARKMCIRLLRKIQGDLKHADTEDTHTRLNPEYSQSVITPHRHVRTRLYFTSESHVHSIINALRYGKMFESENQDAQWKRAIDFLSEIPELHYMTQIVLMLYEDPTADLQSDNRFHIELHFSSGAKTLNDQSRGRSAEPKPSRPVSPGVPSTHPESPPGDTSEGDKPAPEPGDRKAEPGSPAPFASVETHLSESSGIRDSEKTQTETKPMDLEDACGEQDKMEETDKGYNSELYSEEDDKNYNERPRCAIGMEDFSDPSSSPVSIDKLEGSQLLASESDMGAVDEEMPARYGQRRPSRSSSEGNLKKASEFKEAVSVSLENSEEINRRNSDSEAFCRTDLQEKQEPSREAYVAVDSAMPDETKEMEGDRRPSFHRARSLSVSYLNETPSDMELPTQSNSASKSGESRASCMEAETMSLPDTDHMSFPNPEPMNRRAMSTSLVPDLALVLDQEESHSTRHPCACSHPTSAKSDSVVEKRRRVSTSELSDKDTLVREVQSSPTFKLASSRRGWRSPVRAEIGSVYYLPAFRAVTRKISLQNYGAFRVRPLTISKEDPKRPPIADFYTEGTIAASLHPLQTLHNSIKLKRMDQFLERLCSDGSEESDVSTPATSPKRKRPSKKLELKSSTNRVLTHEDSVVGLDLDFGDLAFDSSDKNSPDS